MKAGANKQFVLDASLALAWCFEDESTAYSENILDALMLGSKAITSAIWPFEVANALLMGERRKRISPAQVTAVLQRIGELPISVEPVRIARAFGSILSLARQEQLTEYDASYLELALQEGVSIATLDDRLRRVANRVGVPLT